MPSPISSFFPSFSGDKVWGSTTHVRSRNHKMQPNTESTCTYSTISKNSNPMTQGKGLQPHPQKEEMQKTEAWIAHLSAPCRRPAETRIPTCTVTCCCAVVCCATFVLLERAGMWRCYFRGSRFLDPGIGIGIGIAETGFVCRCLVLFKVDAW